MSRILYFPFYLIPLSILFLLLYRIAVAKLSIYGNDEIETKSTFIHNFSPRNVKFEGLIIDDYEKDSLLITKFSFLYFSQELISNIDSAK